MNWLWHVWVLAVTFMTDLSLCLVTVVITMQQYYTENRKKKYFFNSTNTTILQKIFLLIFLHLGYPFINSEWVQHAYVWQRDRYIYTYTLSIIFWKCTSTVQLCTSLCWSELWISTESFFDLIFWALYPNTKSIESITLDFPLPFGPMMQEKR